MASEDEQTPTPTKKKLPVVAVIGIGCFLIILLSLLAFGIAFTVAGKFLFSSGGSSFLKTAIERTVGLSVENGKTENGFVVTDKKTGASIEVGEANIPASFPKDFPLYPKAKPAGSAVGTEKSTGKGFWLLLESADPVSKVTKFYSEQFEAKSWTVSEVSELPDGTTYRVKKDKLAGTVIVSGNAKEGKTTILITLEPTNEQNPEPQDVSAEGLEPVDEPN